MGELFEIVNKHDQVIGRAPRAECHGNPALLHRTAHVVVFSADGRLLLQKRAANKDIQPGKWDTAVGGHLAPGETYEQGARREMHEELGVPGDLPLTWLFRTRIRNDIESENVGVFQLTYNGPFHAQEEEIDELKFWCPGSLRRALGTGIFTPNLELEIHRLLGEGLL
ncbi:MAG: NUDIX domain-containing protein [Victivallales bacterium]|jgi:isopentenyldiphosphate isomerase|nr:NUDIX domain-containing protein [Victivallales bacterium]